MMSAQCRSPLRIFALLLVLLAGCRVELYSGLQEDEANQMVALLLLKNIDASKVTVKAGEVTIKVAEPQFVDAVEILRQHGLPRRKTDTMSDLFPPGQLVTSPAQERAKLTYLKEQQLEKILSVIDGVVDAQVAIAESVGEDSGELRAATVSVFIKHSPSVNLPAREAELRALLLGGVPNVDVQDISLMFQATEYRFAPIPVTAPTAAVGAASPARKPAGILAPPEWQTWAIAAQSFVQRHAMEFLAGLGIVIGGLLALFWRRHARARP